MLSHMWISSSKNLPILNVEILLSSFLTLIPSLCLPEKTEDDVEREARLVEQWVGLTEERNAVLVPAPGSGIPGAPADW